jgi:type VI secretion system protein ImpA
MSTIVGLSEPLTAQSPCGVSLEETQTLAALEAYRVFGRLTPAETEPEWRRLRTSCLDALKETKDLRILAHLMAASLRLESLPDVLSLFTVVDTWLTRYWDTVYPLIDDDAIMRRNALSLFADRVGIVDALRRLPVTIDERAGPISVRDFDVASGVLVQKEPDVRQLSTDLIRAALAAADSATVRGLSGLVTAASAALQSVESTMLSKGGGSDMVPKLDDAAQTLRRMQEMLAPHVIDIQESSPAAATSAGVSAPKAGEVGSVSSRRDVIRALDTVTNYYLQNEPSSLVPVVIERAKRLVSMSFLDALAEVAPEVVDPVKKAVGVRESTS